MSRDPETEMNPERWRRVQHLFDAALDLSPGDRASYLDQECGDDDAMRQAVEEMLANFAEAGSTFMENPAAKLGDDIELPPSAEQRDAQVQPGDRIGDYVLEKLLGSGGVGRVYLAKRERDFEKLVAVKLLKRGMDTDELVRRFVSERQILAQLEHPNVAKLLDGGASEDGRHYLVMEYVDGVPIDTYCAEHNLDVRQRLDLFLKVCDAVHFAHRNLVVHRDLKPSNILVGQDGEPKLLDFGIAKLLRPEAFPQTVLPTAPGWRAMTPEYASPEQVRGGLISTASDVYSLAVVLYVLLTGRRPYRLESRSLIDVERAVCSTPAMRPSRAVTRVEGESEQPTTGTYIGVDRKKLKQRLSGDLDNILLMALEKEPERRYQSVEQMAADLRRHLDNMPVLARKDSFFYRGSKFVRRHRLPLAATSLVALMLVTFTLTLFFQQEEILRQRDRAASVTDFLEGLFKTADPSEDQGRNLTALALLEKGVLDIESRLAGQPGLQGDLLATMGESYASLGLLNEAEDLLQRSLELLQSAYGPRDPSVASVKARLGDLFITQGNYDLGGQLADEALQLQLEVLGKDHRDVVETRLTLAAHRQRVGAMDEADQFYTLAENGARQLSDEGLLVEVLSRRGAFEHILGNLERARQMLEEGLRKARRLYGEMHPEVAAIVVQYAKLEQGHDYERASELFEEAIEIQRKVFRNSHHELAKTLSEYGLLRKTRGDLAEAETLLNEVITLQNKVHPEGSVTMMPTLNNLAGLRKEQGDLEEAEQLYQRALEINRRVLGERHSETAINLSNLGDVYSDSQRLDEAKEHYQLSLDILVESYGEVHGSVAKGYINLGSLAVKQGNFADAEAFFPKAIEIFRELSEEHSELPKAYFNWARLRDSQKRYDEAKELYLQGLDIARKAQGEDSQIEGQLLNNLAINSYRRDAFEEAEDWARQGIEVFEASREPGDEFRLRMRRILAVIYRDQDRFADAEEVLLGSIEECQERFGEDVNDCARPYESLQRLYTTWGKTEKVEEIGRVLAGG